MIQGNSLAIWRKVKLDPQLFLAYIRTNSKSIKTLNKIPKLQYITLVESSTEDYFYNLNVKKAFLTVVQNSESVKGKTDTGDLHKHQELLHGKNYHKQDQWEILLLLIQRMGLISLTYKEFLHFKRKRLNNPIEMRQRIRIGSLQERNTNGFYTHENILTLTRMRKMNQKYNGEPFPHETRKLYNTVLMRTHGKKAPSYIHCWQ